MKRRCTLSSLSLVWLLAVLLGGCCSFSTVRQLDKAKEQAGKGDYPSVSAMEVTCDAACEGCNQLHLVKGDACYRLAKQGRDPLKQYGCAATEFSEGIRQTNQWPLETANLNRPQTYENLCESLRNWRDLSRGGEADAINGRLLDTAQAFLAAEAGNPCALYFLYNAHYATLRPCLLNPASCPDLCRNLQGMLQNIEAAVPSSRGSHCEQGMQEMQREFSNARELVHCR